MSKILTTGDGKWYDELKAVAYYSETEFERWIYQHTESLFPYHHVIPFKKEVASRKTGKISKPDLALIRRDFSDWTVVEIELNRHTLNHVLEQTSVFRDGEYNLLEIARYARDNLRKFCKKNVPLWQLQDLFDSHSPSILVIVDEYAENWKKDLGKSGIQFGVFEIYKNVRGHHVYRIFGEYPKVHDIEAHCRAHPSLSNVIEVIGNFTFSRVDKEGAIDVVYDEYLTKWRPYQEKRKQYLLFAGISNPLPLSRSDTYYISKDKDGKYYLKRS